MPTYEYECSNQKCQKGKKPHEFSGFQPLAKYKEPVPCPKCKSTKHVKKVVRSAFPKSQSWRVS